MWRNVLDFSGATVHLQYFFTGTNLWHLVLVEELKVRNWGSLKSWMINRWRSRNVQVQLSKLFYVCWKTLLPSSPTSTYLETLMFIQGPVQLSRNELQRKLALFKWFVLVWFFFSPSSFHGIFTSFSFSDFKLKQALNLCSVEANGKIPTYLYHPIISCYIFCPSFTAIKTSLLLQLTVDCLQILAFLRWR